ncbi:MAG: hypothetical protein AB7G93_02500 [Bdellovibrionales bacterium]
MALSRIFYFVVTTVALTLAMAIIGIRSAWTFPENVRHGYQSCATCHYSPSGGGVLTPYGRSLSKELISTWAWEGEERALYAFDSGSFWDLGGNVRFLQLYTNDEIRERARFFPMQMDVEPVLHAGRWAAVGTLGVHRQKNETNTYETEFLSRRHYLLFQATDEWHVRTGRFFPQFGIMIPDHNRLSRRQLGFDHGQETLNLELGFASANVEVFLTAVFDQYRVNLKENRQGAVASAAWLLQRSKVGLSVYRLTDPSQTRAARSVWAQIGFNERVFLLSEISHMSDKPKASGADASHALVAGGLLGYEAIRGFIPYGVFEWEQVEVGASQRVTDVQGIGVQWLPRPHWEVKLELQKRHSPTLDADWAFLLVHFYL